MTRVTPAEPFDFSYSTLSVSDSLDEGCDAWESKEYVSVHLHELGSVIDYDWELLGDYPPGLSISGGIISGTVESGIFKSLIPDFTEKRERGTIDMEVGSSEGEGEDPSPYTFGSGEIVKIEYKFTVAGMDSDPKPDVYVEEDYSIVVGKNLSTDMGDYEPRDLFEDGEELI